MGVGSGAGMAPGSGVCAGADPGICACGGKADNGDNGRAAGAKDGVAAGVGIAGFSVAGKIDAGSSGGRAVPNVEVVRCPFDRPGADEVLIAGGSEGPLGGVGSGSFTPVGNSLSGKIWFSGAGSMGLGA